MVKMILTNNLPTPDVLFNSSNRKLPNYSINESDVLKYYISENYEFSKEYEII